MYVVFNGTEDVAQFDVKEDAENFAKNSIEAYGSGSYRVEFVYDYCEVKNDY